MSYHRQRTVEPLSAAVYVWKFGGSHCVARKAAVRGYQL